MTDEETLVFAAAIAAASIGLVATLLLSALAVIGSWRLFRTANQASDLVLRLASNAIGGDGAADPSQFLDIRRQLQTLIEQQRGLQESTGNLLDTVAVDDGVAGPPLSDLESAVIRLDGTIGQMAASLANLIQLLERQQGYKEPQS